MKIIDYPGQINLRDNVKKTPNVQNAPSVSITAKKEPKVLIHPTGQLSTPILSIEELKQKALERNTITSEDISSKPQHPFTYDQLKMHWRVLAFEIRSSQKEGAESAYAIMSKREPILNDLSITYAVENTFMEELLKNNFGNEILSYLRNKLNNWGISFQVILKDNSEALTTKQTSKERFHQMAQKNINLNSLLKTFDLDIEP